MSGNEWTGGDGYWTTEAGRSDITVSVERNGEVCVSVSSDGAPYQGIWLTAEQWRAMCALPVLPAGQGERGGG